MDDVPSRPTQQQAAERLQQGGPKLCRRLEWAVALGVLTGEDWASQLAAKRKRYSDEREKSRPKVVDVQKMDPLQCHPLAAGSANPWNRKRQADELRQDIKQDVERTFPEERFFTQSRTQEALTEMLFVYSSTLPCPPGQDNAYRQGMNDIAAITWYVVVHDEVKDDPLRAPEHSEADAFILFEVIMSHILDLYEVGQSKDRKAVADVESALGKQDKANHSAVLRRCNLIFHEKLKTADPALYKHLEPYVTPQVFLLRWLRLLFAREFAFPHVVHVWDRIFAESVKKKKGFGFADQLAVAMMVSIRQQLLAADETAILMLLMKFEPIANPRPVLDLARNPRPAAAAPPPAASVMPAAPAGNAFAGIPKAHAVALPAQQERQQTPPRGLLGAGPGGPAGFGGPPSPSRPQQAPEDGPLPRVQPKGYADTGSHLFGQRPPPREIVPPKAAAPSRPAAPAGNPLAPNPLGGPLGGGPLGGPLGQMGGSGPSAGLSGALGAPTSDALAAKFSGIMTGATNFVRQVADSAAGGDKRREDAAQLLQEALVQLEAVQADLARDSPQASALQSSVEQVRAAHRMLLPRQDELL